MARERDPRAVMLTAEWLGVGEDEVLVHEQTAYEVRATLALALDDFKDALRNSNLFGRFVVWLVEGLSRALSVTREK
jgi:hypothetical protein